MNINALRYLLKDREELIQESARDNKLNEDNVMGVAHKIAGEGNIDGLSEKQQYLFENAILPLIDEVPCTGWFDEFDGDEGSHFDCQNIIEEARLIECYREENMLCENCSEEESYRAAHKAAFMRED